MDKYRKDTEHLILLSIKQCFYSIMYFNMIITGLIFKESTFVIPNRYYTTLFFGLTVKFGPLVWSSGQEYSVVQFLFIRSSGFYLLGRPVSVQCTYLSKNVY